MKKIFFICFSFGILFPLYAQQYTLFSLYRENSFLANPAIAGAQQDPVLAISYRDQWRKIEGAPNTFAATYKGRIGKSPHGVGGMIMNDQTGPTSFTSVTFAYAFHIDFYKINPFFWSEFLRKSKISMGISTSIFQYRLNANKLRLDNPNDAAVAQANESSFRPNAAAGFYYYYDNLYFGFSVPLLLPISSKFENGIGTSKLRQVNHYFGVLGGRIVVKKRVSYIEPILWLRFVKNTPFAWDFHARYNYKDKWWAGIGYRSSETAIIEGGFTINKKIKIGYAYDQGISNIAGRTAGAHELIISYHFIDPRRRY